MKAPQIIEIWFDKEQNFAQVSFGAIRKRRILYKIHLSDQRDSLFVRMIRKEE